MDSWCVSTRYHLVVSGPDQYRHRPCHLAKIRAVVEMRSEICLKTEGMRRQRFPGIWSSSISDRRQAVEPMNPDLIKQGDGDDPRYVCNSPAAIARLVCRSFVAEVRRQKNIAFKQRAVCTASEA